MKSTWKFLIITLFVITSLAGSGASSAFAAGTATPNPISQIKITSVPGGKAREVSFAGPTLALAATQSSVTSVPGGKASNVYTVTTGGSYQGAVSLAASGLPAGVTAAWSQNSFTPATATSSTNATLNLSVASTVKPGLYSYNVTASGDGQSATSSYSLAVQGITASVSLNSLSMSATGTASVNVFASLLGGVSTTAALTQARIASGLPSGVTASWGTPAVAANGTVTYPLTLTGSATAVASTGTLQFSTTVTDVNTKAVYTATASSALTVTNAAPTLVLSAAQTTATAVQGGSASDVYTVATGGSYHGVVSLSVSGLPTGVTATWSQSSFTPATAISTTTSTLSFSVASTVKAGTYTYNVTAAGDSLSVKGAYTLIVNQVPGVTAAVNLTSLSMKSMGTATLNLVATPFGGVTTTAALTQARIVSGLPSGVTASWGTPVVASSGAVTCSLTLTGSVKAVASTGTLQLSVTVTDANTKAAYTATASSALTVSYVAPTLAFTTTVSQPAAFQGGSVSNVYTVTTGGSFQGAVTLSVSGLPTGVTTTWSPSSFTPASATSTTNSTLNFNVASSVKPNWYTFSVTAAGDGLSVTWSYTLIVNQAPGTTASVNYTSISMKSTGTATLNLYASPFGGVVTTAALTQARIVSGLPSGVTASWGTPVVASSGMVTCPLTLTGSATAVASTDTLQLSVTVTDATTKAAYTATTSSTLTVSYVAPTIGLTAVVNKPVALQGGSASNVYTVTTGGSFHGAVTLTVSGLPASVTTTWSQSSFTPASATSTTNSTLSFSVPSSLSTNWYTYYVTAAGDGQSVTWAYTLIVEPVVGLSVTPSNADPMVNAGQSTTVTITAAPMNGIKITSGSATAAITSTLPTGIKATLGVPVTNSNGSVAWPLTFAAGSSAVAGTYPLALQVGIVDSTSGEPYSLSQPMNLMVSLLANIVPGTTAGSSIPAGFLGFNHEWKDGQNIVGSTATGVNTIYRKLISNLTAYNTGTMNLRIGGNSTDSSSEPTSTSVAPFAQLAGVLPVNFDLGVNLGKDNVALAVDQATAFFKQMPAGSVPYLEIGNEPNLYATNGTRSTSYTYADFLADNTNWNNHLIPLLPTGVKLMGPAWAGYQNTAGTESFLANQPSEFGAYSAHYYAASPTSIPAPDFLLSSAAVTTLPAALVGPVAAVHAAGATYRIDELGPISDAGTVGLSNGFQSALWSVDLMFALTQVGVDGVNWQASDGNYNNPFVFKITGVTATTNSYSLTTVTPLYYGLLFFQRAVANEAKFVPVTVTTGANLTAWATLDPTADEERVVILNKDETYSGAVALNAAGYTTATVTRLLAPSYSSTNGVTLGGQTFDGSTDGSIKGTLTEETYTSKNGVFLINMPTISGALVVMKP